MASKNPSVLTLCEQQKLVMKLNIFKIQGTDKRGNPILHIFGKLFPGRIVSVEAVMKYLDEEIFPGLNGKTFSVVYMNSGVTRAENFPGIFSLHLLFKAMPVEVRDNMESVYIVHPSFQCRFFLSAFGRILFTLGGGLYCKLRFVYRLEFLWDNIRREEFEIPKFVSDFDEELEYRPQLDLALEGDRTRLIFWSPAQFSLVNDPQLRQEGQGNEIGIFTKTALEVRLSSLPASLISRTLTRGIS